MSLFTNVGDQPEYDKTDDEHYQLKRGEGDVDYIIANQEIIESGLDAYNYWAYLSLSHEFVIYDDGLSDSHWIHEKVCKIDSIKASISNPVIHKNILDPSNTVPIVFCDSYAPNL